MTRCLLSTSRHACISSCCHIARQILSLHHRSCPLCFQRIRLPISRAHRSGIVYPYREGFQFLASEYHTNLSVKSLCCVLGDTIRRGAPRVVSVVVVDIPSCVDIPLIVGVVAIGGAEPHDSRRAHFNLHPVYHFAYRFASDSLHARIRFRTSTVLFPQKYTRFDAR